ncbi:hypothetical protein ACHWQZ_G006831 [Mnemiopsis leidyi]
MRIPTHVFLYTSHALSRWGDRMWSFAIGIFLIYLHPQSFMLTAIYSLIVNLFGTCLAGPIGRKVDTLPRLTTMRTALIIQNSSVAAAAILIVVAFQLQISYYCNEPLFFVFVTLVTILGIVSTLSSSATKMIMERDWIVVLSKQDTDMLSEINAMMRRIDQVCLLLAPIVAGAFMTALDTTWAAGLIAVWNVVSFFFEYTLLRTVHTRVPELAQKETPPGDEEKDRNLAISPLKKIQHLIESYFRNVGIFFSQDVALTGFCLSLVYLTVLGFDNITVGYLRLNNVKDLYIAITMAVGACFGVFGTVCYTPFTKKFGVSASGALGAVTLAISYGVCLASVPFSKDHLKSIPVPDVSDGGCGDDIRNPLVSGPILIPTMLILIGITTMRYGLWIFDLSISQSFQLSVPEHQRNTVGGVQSSFNSFFNFTYILLTALYPNPTKFDILILISCAACILSCVLYLGWYLKTGGLKVILTQRDDGSVPEEDGKDVGPEAEVE